MGCLGGISREYCDLVVAVWAAKGVLRLVRPILPMETIIPSGPPLTVAARRRFRPMPERVSLSYFELPAPADLAAGILASISAIRLARVSVEKGLLRRMASEPICAFSRAAVSV